MIKELIMCLVPRDFQGCFFNQTLNKSVRSHVWTVFLFSGIIETWGNQTELVLKYKQQQQQQQQQQQHHHQQQQSQEWQNRWKAYEVISTLYTIFIKGSK